MVISLLIHSCYTGIRLFAAYTATRSKSRCWVNARDYGLPAGIEPAPIHLRQDDSFSYDAEYEGILAVGEVGWPVRSLPAVVVLHEVHVVQRTVIEFRII